MLHLHPIAVSTYLAHPDGYYQQVCVPRQAKGIMYGQLHKKRQAPKVGGDPHGAEGEEGLPGWQTASTYGQTRPRTNEGKPIWWDGATHMGRSRGKDCNHAHQPITTTKGLRWTVLAQLIRRGGLKSGLMAELHS